MEIQSVGVFALTLLSTAPYPCWTTAPYNEQSQLLNLLILLVQNLRVQNSAELPRCALGADRFRCSSVGSCSKV